jgi:hypothetical protein
VPALVAAPLEMLMTKSTAELPGVTGMEGLNRHCVSAGSPVQENTMAELNVEPGGFGTIVIW